MTARKPSGEAAAVKKDAEGAMAPSQADSTNDGAHSADPSGDATRPKDDHSAPTTPRTDNENAGEE